MGGVSVTKGWFAGQMRVLHMRSRMRLELRKTIATTRFEHGIWIANLMVVT